MIKGPSEHLSWKELACKDGTNYPKEFVKDGRVFQLAILFEDIRSLFGNKPIQVLSAYRTKVWNIKIRGALKSQHMEGRALDLKAPKGITNAQFYEKIYQNKELLGLKGLGRYRTFVHVDIRPSIRIVIWSGHGVKDS